MKRHYLFLMRSYVAGVLYQRGEKAELDSDKMKGLIKMGAVQELPEPVAPAPAVTTQSVETVAPVTALTPNVPVMATLPPVEPTELTEHTVAEPVLMDTVEPTGATAIQATAMQATAIQATGTQDSPSNDTNVYGNLTKAQLNAELDKRGIAHDAKATNAELEALLVADDEQKSAATATAPVTPDV